MDTEGPADIDAIAERVAAKLKKPETQLLEEQLLRRSALLDQQIRDASFLQQHLGLERSRIRKMSLWWVALCLVTLMTTLGHWDRGSVPRTAASFVAFLLVWRGLYMDENGKNVVLAVIITLIGLLLM